MTRRPWKDRAGGAQDFVNPFGRNDNCERAALSAAARQEQATGVLAMRCRTLFRNLALAAVLTAVGTGGGHAATVIFDDDFGKPFINEAWQIRNDSADMRALDSGKLAIVTEPGSLSKGKAKNVLVLKDKLMAKNADISATLTVDIQDYGTSWASRVLGGIVLDSSKDNYLILYIVNFGANYKSDSGPVAVLAKRHNGTVRPYLSRRLAPMKKGPMAFHLRIEKRGYKYAGFASLDGKKWQKLGTFGVLNKSFRPGLFALRGNRANEAIYEFDRFTVTSLD